MTRAHRHLPASALCLTLFYGLLLHTTQARAACTPSPAGAQHFSFTFDRQIIDTPRDAPVGTVLARAVATGTTAVSLTCTAGTYPATGQILVAGVLPPTSAGTFGLEGVHTIPDAGFGFRIVMVPETTSLYNRTTTVSLGGTTRYERRAGDFRLELVKTSTDTIRQRQLAAQDLYRATLDGHETMRLRLAGTVHFAPATCVSSIGNTQTVNLGRVRQANLTGVNTTPDDPRPASFRLQLDCRNYAGKVRLTFTDASDHTNIGNTLAPAPESTARGVGVQILFNGVAVGFGPDSSSPSNSSNQFDVFNSTGTEVDAGHRAIEFRARYLQTAGTTVPGTIRARATATFSYQ